MSGSAELGILRWNRRIISTSATISVALGAIALIGWFIGDANLLSGWGTGIAMRFNTAVCIIAAGVAVSLVAGDDNPVSAVAAKVCAIFICLIAIPTLFQYLFDWDLGIDQFFWRDTISPTAPGRMAPVTAVFLTLIGLSLLTIRSRSTALVWMAQICAVFGCLVAQWGILEVLFREKEKFGIAISTAFAVMALGIGVMIVPNQAGFLQSITQDTSGGRLLRRLLPTILIVPSALGCLRRYLTWAGHLELRSGIGILVTLFTAALLLIVFFSARSSDAIERERLRLQEEINGFFSLPLHTLLSIIRFDGRFQRISSSWQQTLGLSEEQILGTPYIEFLHPDDRETTNTFVQKIEHGTHVVDFQNRCRAADGTYRWLAWNVIPAENQLMYAIAEDITERKRMENELRENAERSRMLIEGLEGASLYMLDPDGHIMTWNSGARLMTGYDSTEVLGQPVAILYTAEEASRITPEYLRSVAASSDHKEAQKWRVRKDGSRFLCEAYIWAVSDSAGRAMGFVKLVRDVTERVAVEEKIRRLNEELEQRVKVRTEELASSNRELEAFAYSVSHDLRAPLRHMDGFVALLRQRAYPQLDEGARRYVDKIIEASRRMGTLIDELLQFSRLGRTTPHRRPIDLNALVNEVRQELEPETRERIVRWDVGKLPVVFADLTMLRGALQNLLGNALKYTRGRTEASICIRGITDSKGEVSISISDNGVGFDMRFYDKLFGVFQRLHGEDEFEGTGIGLANVRRIVERHGGRVWAESEVNKGATFHVSLPRISVPAGGEHEHLETYLVGGRQQE